MEETIHSGRTGENAKAIRKNWPKKKARNELAKRQRNAEKGDRK